MNYNNILPQDKGDIERAKALFKYRFEDLKPKIKSLLYCLQDSNWPIAYYVAEYLKPHGKEMTQEILEILDEDDEILIVYIILAFMTNIDYRLDEQILIKLRRFRDFPTKAESDEELDIIAAEVLLQQEKL